MVNKHLVFLSKYAQLPTNIVYKGIRLNKVWQYVEPYYTIQYIADTGDIILEYKVLDNQVLEDMIELIDIFNRNGYNYDIKALTGGIVQT